MRQGAVAAALRMRYVRRNAPVAQLDRALPSEGRGQGFESLRARHFDCQQRNDSASHTYITVFRRPPAQPILRYGRRRTKGPRHASLHVFHRDGDDPGRYGGQRRSGPEKVRSDG